MSEANEVRSTLKFHDGCSMVVDLEHRGWSSPSIASTIITTFDSMSQPPNFQAPVVEVSTCLLELFGSPVLLLVRLEEQLVVDVELVQKLIRQVQLRQMAMLLQGQESLWARCQTALSQESSHQCSVLCWQPCWLRWQVLHLLSQVPSGQLQLEVSPSSA